MADPSSSTADPFPVRPRQPILLTAWRVTDERRKHIAQWCSGTVCSNDGRCVGVMFVDANDVPQFAPVGHYIVRGVTGLFAARSPEQLAEMYEEVAADGPS